MLLQQQRRGGGVVSLMQNNKAPNKTKSLAANSIYNVIYRLLNTVFPLIATVYSSHILLSSGVGKVTSAQNIVSYFILIASLGIPTYGIKAIAVARQNKERLSQTFWELFIINLISSVACSLCFIVMIENAPFIKGEQALYLVAGLNLFANVLNVDWFYQGLEEYKYITLRSISVKAVSYGLMFIFVRDRSDYIVYALLSSTALVGNYFFNAIRVWKYITPHFTGLHFSKHLKPIMFLLASTVAVEVYTLADTTMITFMCNDSAVGMYDVASKVIRVVRGVCTAACAVFLPRLSMYYSQNQLSEFKDLIGKGFKMLLIFTIPAAAGIILIANPAIVLLFGESFEGSIFPAQILAVSIISVALSGFFGNQVLVTVGKEKTVMLSTMLGAAANVCLNSILIPCMGISGAAIASVITELGVAAFQMFNLRNSYLPKTEGKFWLSVGISIAIMSGFVLLMKALIANSIIRVAVAIVAGVIGYTIGLLITRNEVVFEIINKIQQHKK